MVREHVTRSVASVAFGVLALVAASCSAPGGGSAGAGRDGGVAAGPALVAGAPDLVAADAEPQPPKFDLDLSGLDLSGIELDDEEPAGEDPAQPPAVDESAAAGERENGGGLDEAPDNLDDLIDIPLALDPGSALACAAFELGRDAAVDGDAGFGVMLAERVTTNGETIDDSAIRDLALLLAAAPGTDVVEVERGLARCQELGYETAS